jgi:polyhydroxybutyrate depolymerase
MHVPPAARCQRQTPLVMLFHGGGGNGAQAANSYQMNPIADREGFFVVYPDGTAAAPGLGLLTWNSGYCCAYAYDNRVDDVGFVRALVASLKSSYPIDPERIYATGFSNGAMMTYRLGAELSELFAAIAPVAGSIGGTTGGVRYTIPEPARALPVLIQHGKLDQNIPYAGGIGQDSQISNRVDRPVADAVEFWRANNGCARTPVTKRAGNVVMDRYTGCRSDADVRLYTIENGKHAWAGGRMPTVLSGDVPSYEYSASEVIWSFFAAHPRKRNVDGGGGVGGRPAIAPDGVVNGASFQKGSIAPGELLTIFGRNLGPAQVAAYQFEPSGRLSTAIGGTRILVDGVAAPMYYAVEGQVSGFVPYAAGQKQCVDLQVSYDGETSEAVRLAVAGAQPAIFSRDYSGTGPGVIYNQDGTVNSGANRAARGSIIAMYLTGEGLTAPAGVDGKPGEANPTRPVLPVTVYLNGIEAEVLYAGGVKDAVAGVFQVNARVPAGVPVSDAVPVMVQVGAGATPFGITLATR